MCLLCVQPLTGLTNLSVFYLLILLHRNHVHFMAFSCVISCAKVWSRHCFAKIVFGQLTLSQEKRGTKSKTFVCAFVPLAFYPIIIGCAGFVSLTTRLLGGWIEEFGSNSYLIWLFVSYLLVKFLLVDKRQTSKRINKTHMHRHRHRELFNS